MARLSLRQIVRFLGGAHVPPEEHVVVIDGIPGGVCTRASFRNVVTLHAIEFPVDYAYELGGRTTTLSARLRFQGLGSGGREQIRVDGQDVTADDVLVGFETGNEGPSAYVEFRYDAGEGLRSVKFVAPLASADV